MAAAPTFNTQTTPIITTIVMREARIFPRVERLLYMDPYQQIRLECLRLALAAYVCPEEAVASAQKLYDFVINGTVPAGLDDHLALANIANLHRGNDTVH